MPSALPVGLIVSGVRLVAPDTVNRQIFARSGCSQHRDPSEIAELPAVNDIGERLAVDVSQRWMEEARMHVSRCFNHSRYPRSVAARHYIFSLTEVGAADNGLRTEYRN
jgi:hypothetical protein